jgi:hypothetical protein
MAVEHALYWIDRSTTAYPSDFTLFGKRRRARSRLRARRRSRRCALRLAQ